MANEKEFKLIIGGEFTTQPKHKPKLIPEDFLAQFNNVKANDFEEIINFANFYSFGGYLVPDEENSITEKFVKIQSKYNQIIKNILLELGKISYSDIQTINKDLEATTPEICLRDKINDLQKIANGFDIYTLRNVKGEQPNYKVNHMGLFSSDKKNSHIRVTITVPPGSKTLWYSDRIKDGVLTITDIFPSDVWESQEEYLDSVILNKSHIRLDPEGQPISIELNFWLGKTDFTKEELAATWSIRSASGESFIAKRIWDYLNAEYKDNKFKLCKICSNLHTGRSKDYCEKEGCRKEWDSRRKRSKK